ncbi:phage portal protein [Vibrio parahaemolyticus]|nr:phage portal protein [Vibrio parahaemolyticus]
MLLNTKSIEAFDEFGNNSIASFISGSGMTVTYDSALKDPTVMACIRIISQTISTLPLKLYKKQNGKKGKEWVLDEDSVMSYILTVRPNNRQTAVEFIEQLVGQLMTYSEYFAQIVRSPSGKVIGLVPFNNPQQVSVSEVGDGLRYDCVTNAGKTLTLFNDEILHIRDLSLTTYKALDKINYAKSSIGLSLSATKNAENYYKKGSRAGGFIQADGHLSDSAHARLQNQFNDYMGNENAHRIVILESGVKYIENKYSLKDAQVLESRNSSIREIAAIFGVPVSLLGVETTSLTDPTSVNAFFYKSCLQSIINKIESRFNLMLPRGYVIKFDVSEYLRGDPQSTAEVAEKLFTRGLISRNEARAKLGMQADTKEEIYAISTNNIVFGSIDGFTDSNIQTQKQFENNN